MTTDSTRPTASSTEGEHFLCDDWFDPLENGVRTRIRGFIEELLEAELDAALGRARYERPGGVGDEFPRGPPARVMAIGNVAFWALSAPRRFACRAPGWRPPEARRRNGGTRPSPPSSGGRNGPTP